MTERPDDLERYRVPKRRIRNVETARHAPAVFEFFEAFCDLLGRPTVFQPINDGSRKFAGLGAIAALDVTLIDQHLRGPMPVAVSLRNIVVVSPVTVYLAVDRRTVSS